MVKSLSHKPWCVNRISMVRPLDARAVAVKALSAYGAGLLEAVAPSTRGRARAAFKKKLARRRSK
jgi:hypothetical protein